jgi:hypothetical protein
VIVHVGETGQEDAICVRPLLSAALRTVGRGACAIENCVLFGIPQGRVFVPVPDLVGPVDVCLVTSVATKASSELEKASVGYGILVVVTDIEREDLPAEATATSL